MHNLTRKIFILVAGVFLTSVTLSGCFGTEEVKKSRVLEISEYPKFIADGIRKVILVENGEEIFCLSNEPQEYKMNFDYWEILNPYDENVTVNTEMMYELFHILCSWDFQTPVAVEDGVDTGISESNTRITVEFVNTTDTSEAKSTAYADKTATIILGNEDGMGNRFAAVQGFEDQIYKVSAETIRSVYGVDPFSFVLKIPVLVNIDTVKRVEIETEKKTYDMQVDSKAGEYYFDGKPVKKETFTSIYQEICATMLVAEADTEQVDTSQDPDITVTFYRNQDKYPEIKVEYFSYDIKHDLVQVNGNAYFLVNAEDVKQLITLAEELI